MHVCSAVIIVLAVLTADVIPIDARAAQDAARADQEVAPAGQAGDDAATTGYSDTARASIAAEAVKYSPFSARRIRPSFQARLSGGMDLVRPTYGVGGMVQVGAGFNRWVDVRFGVGFPGYFLVLDIEFNLYPYGRFVPTLGLRASFDPISAQETRTVEMNFGCEFWILDWLAAFIEVGLGMSVSHHDNFDPQFVAPAWVGVEMRY